MFCDREPAVGGSLLLSVSVSAYAGRGEMRRRFGAGKRHSVALVLRLRGHLPAETLLIFCFAGRLPSSFLMHERLLHGFPVHDRWPRGDLIRACMVLRIRGPRPALKSLRNNSMVCRRLRVLSLPRSCHAHSLFRCTFCLRPSQFTYEFCMVAACLSCGPGEYLG